MISNEHRKVDSNYVREHRRCGTSIFSACQMGGGALQFATLKPPTARARVRVGLLRLYMSFLTESLKKKPSFTPLVRLSGMYCLNLVCYPVCDTDVDPRCEIRY